MEAGDLELLAESTYSEWAPPSKIVREEGIEIHLIPNLRTLEQVGKSMGRWIIAIRASLRSNYTRFQFAVAHGRGHIALLEAGFPVEEHREDWCDYFAAAMIIPRRMVRDDAVELARVHKTTETLANLRIGEVLREPVAVITPQVVRARGEAQWPEERVLRGWERKPGPGLVATRLGDDRKRTLIRRAV